MKKIQFAHLFFLLPCVAIANEESTYTHAITLSASYGNVFEYKKQLSSNTALLVTTFFDRNTTEESYFDGVSNVDYTVKEIRISAGVGLRNYFSRDSFRTFLDTIAEVRFNRAIQEDIYSEDKFYYKSLDASILYGAEYKFTSRLSIEGRFGIILDYTRRYSPYEDTTADKTIRSASSGLLLSYYF